MSDTASVHVFGIRHHGPGSARSLRQALEELRPDAILIEGPPDAEGLIPSVVHEQMQPPVAILIYVPEDPKVAAYYPFAVFSPEWQALRYGLETGCTLRFIDLPQMHRMAMRKDEGAGMRDEEGASGSETPALPGEPEAAPDEGAEANAPDEGVHPSSLLPHPSHDPLGWLAQAAGYSDGERWWDHLVEQRRDGADLFAAVLEGMTVLRESVAPDADPVEAQREAYMRQCIRRAKKDGFQRIAVVCGAWHAPALVKLPPAKEDTALLQGLPKIKVQATWVPWTHGRLSYFTGYGAGIESPGWYQHLWTYPEDTVVRWMTRVARLLREEDLDASSAHIIEAVRLADTLAALRGRPAPGLPELSEATQTVLCFGDSLPMRLIEQKLIVGEVLGEIPEDTPMVPLQQDVQKEQKRLRFQPNAFKERIELDLRQPAHLAKSHLLHRLNLLGVPWGQGDYASGKGTFWEAWQLQWQPEFPVAIIEAGLWGNTVREAATARVQDLARNAPSLPALTDLIGKTLPADLPGAIGTVVARLQEEAALASDVGEMMDAVAPLVHSVRYGEFGAVQRTDVSNIATVFHGLAVRICVGLPNACASLNDDAAAVMLRRINTTQTAFQTLDDADLRSMWQDTLARISERDSLHGLVAGRCCRLLLDAGAFDGEEAARRMSRALSVAVEPAHAAAWVEGFLGDSGMVLLLDEALWAVLDEWVASIHPDAFTQLLPLLRRTFARFPAPERRQMGERARSGGTVRGGAGSIAEFDAERADLVLPLIRQLLGLETATAAA